MRSRLVVVLEVVLQNPTQVSPVEHDHMVEAFPPDRANQSLDVAVLPRDLREVTTCSIPIDRSVSTTFSP